MTETRPADPAELLEKWTVRFREPALEAAYRAAKRDVNLRQTRLALAVAIALNSVFGFLDFSIFEANQGAILFLRLAVVNGFLAGLMALSRYDYFRTRWPMLLALGALGYTAFLLIIDGLGQPPVQYLSGFILVLAAIYVLLPFYFVHGAAIAWLCTIVDVGAAPFVFDLDATGLGMLAMQLLSINVIGMYALYRTERSLRLDFVNMDTIVKQRGRIQTLLRRILPASIADRLEAGESDIVEQFGESTVLFADIVGFTKLASEHAPEETLALLNRTFSAFDARVAEHGLEKIKTIGDAYMAAGGVPEGIADHAPRVARLALAMQAATAEIKGPDGRPVAVRIGLHTGPLVAGVIGDTRFLYDLWGDTVNVASRMESLAEPGRIQLTDTVREALGETFRFAPRGEIEVKGKGLLRTWYLLGEAAEGGAEVRALRG